MGAHPWGRGIAQDTSTFEAKKLRPSFYETVRGYGLAVCRRKPIRGYR